MDLDTIKCIKETLNEFKGFLLYYIPSINQNYFLNEFTTLEEYIYNLGDINIEKYERIEKEIIFHKKYIVSYSGFYVKKHSHKDMEYNKIISYIFNIPNHLIRVINNIINI